MSSDKDCIEDLRFYPTMASQEILCRSQSVKGGKAELLYTYIDVEPVVFNRGFYTVDMRYFYRVTLNAYCSCPRPVEIEGLCVFDKRVILFGSEGNAKIFSSQVRIDALDRQMIERSNLPIAVVEAVATLIGRSLCLQIHYFFDNYDSFPVWKYSDIFNDSTQVHVGYGFKLQEPLHLVRISVCQLLYFFVRGYCICIQFSQPPGRDIRLRVQFVMYRLQIINGDQVVQIHLPRLFFSLGDRFDFFPQ